MDKVLLTHKPRIGLVARDEMRIAGLQAVLRDGEQCTLVTLASPTDLDMTGLELVVIDSEATEHLLELLATFRRLRAHVALIVLGPEMGLEHVEAVIGAGAKGYLSYSANEQEIRMAIAVVRDGSVWAPRKVLARLLERSRVHREQQAEPAKMTFTRRELEVLKLLVLGRPNRELALSLGVDEATVKAHVGRLLRKAGVDNRTALTMRALERGWVAR